MLGGVSHMFALVKFCECEEHAMSFMQGQIYTSPLERFVNMEKRGGRFDNREGASYLPEQYTVIVDDESIPVDNSKPTPGIAIRDNRVLRVNVCCLFTVHFQNMFRGAGEIDTHGFKKHQYQMPQQCLEDFGKYCVVIYQPHQFLDRVRTCLAAMLENETIQQSSQNFVRYGNDGRIYNTSMAYRSLVDLAPVFFKETRFQYQKEYRIAVDYNDECAMPRMLSIGEITDISSLANSQKITVHASQQLIDSLLGTEQEL